MNKRILQINAEMQKAISEIITYKLDNPQVTGIITVTKVDTTIDLDNSKVYISVFTTDDEQEVFNQIRHSAVFIRRELAEKLDLKKVPFLNFIADTSIKDNMKIEQLILESKNNNKANEND